MGIGPHGWASKGVRIALLSFGVAAFVVCCSLVTAAAAAAAAAGSAPAFVQQATAHSSSVASIKVTPAANVTSGNRLVVLVGVWNTGDPTAASVTDSAGNHYVELLHFLASDGTEMSVWTAPITAGGGARPTITVTPTAKADMGVAVSEYSGLSTVADASVVDQSSHASGTTSGAGSVASGSTAATSAGNELAIGMYVDSGFGDTLTSGSGWTLRSNVSRTSSIELLTEDQVLASAGATPNATVGTGASTVWLMATVVLQAASSNQPTAPGAPTNVTAAPGDSSATVSWTAPSTNGGSAITTYTITPYIGSTAQTPTTVTGNPPATSATVSGLTDGTTYTFTVTATNAAGTGPPSSPSNAVTPSASGGGRWSALMNWPMVAIHSVLLKNGNVLQFDGWQQPEPTQVWNPSTGTFTTQTAPDSIFCSGMAELPDGRVLVIGGYGGLSTGNLGIVDTSIFDPATSTWTRVANMHYPRWYPDLTELPDGRYVAISGNSTDANTWADTPEVYDPTTSTWTVLNVNTSQIHEEEYPFSYLAPNGEVFTIGPKEDQSFFLNVQNHTWTQVGGSSGVLNGSSVMYRPGQILYTGGTPDQDSSSKATAAASLINLNASTPTWQQTAPMHSARAYHTLTTLADGTVLAVGGEPTWGQTGTSETSGGVLPSEIWDPATQTWTVVASTGATRGYHSTAVLMPDGTVLVGGSGHASPGYPGQYTSQIYSPPYLFKGARPTISSAPASATYGSTIPVSTPDAASISGVNLVSLGADTHQSDMDQHFVPLSFTQGSGGLNVSIPSSAATAPPGNYMLFIVNSSGVPSVASIISVGNPPTAPWAPTGVTAVAGNGSATVSWTPSGNGGSPITSYTITPYIGSSAQTPSTVAAPATSATVNGLTNGTSYTFTVAATNSNGTGLTSAPSNAVTPSATPALTFIQAASAHAPSVSTLAVTPASAVTGGDRLIVETGVWNSPSATVQSVTDSAGDTYVELLHYKASDGTEMSVWTAPVTAGAGTKPTITVTPTSPADMGVAVLEYSGLSTVADATVVDQMAHSSGTTGGAPSTVASGATAATTAGNELALGMYVDSGFGDGLSPGTGYNQRINVSPTGDIEFLAEDQLLSSAGATPNATVQTGPATTWLMATLVLKAASGSGHAADVAGGKLASSHSRRSARKAVSRRTTRHRAVVRHHRGMAKHRGVRTTRCARHASGGRRSSACRSVHVAAAITAVDSARFIYLALLKHLPSTLFCWHGRALPLGGPNWAGAWFLQRRA